MKLMYDKEKAEEANRHFERLPILTDGESKQIRIIDPKWVIVRLKPSVYSYTHNSYADIPETAEERLRASEILWSVLEKFGVSTTIGYVGKDFYISRRLVDVHGLDLVPPIEVIVKGRHVGTPKHKLYGIENYPTRCDARITPDKGHDPYARFDFTNPLMDDKGNRMQDECIPTELADYYIDTKAASYTALKAYAILWRYMANRRLRLDDICFKIDTSGRRIFGEVSQDCMRVECDNIAEGKELLRKGMPERRIVASYKFISAQLRMEKTVEAPRLKYTPRDYYDDTPFWEVNRYDIR